jgi:hypothetical protein
VGEDRANRWVILAFGLIALFDAYLPAYTDRKEFWILDGDAIPGLASFCSLPAVRCGSGRSLCSPTGSADWWPSSPGIKTVQLPQGLTPPAPTAAHPLTLRCRKVDDPARDNAIIAAIS